MSRQTQKVLVICGPTASGKTNLALKIAQLLPRCSILSADSRQIYKGLDIITGKDIPKDLPPSIKIFGVNLIDQREQGNVADYVRYSKKIIDISKSENTPLIIVGGTGLYIKGITSDLSDMLVPQDKMLRSDLESLPLEKLQDRLRKIDEKRFNTLNNSDANNPRRLIRHIEVSLSKQKNFQTPSITKSPTKYIFVGLKPETENLSSRIRKRVMERLDNGAISEVKSLLINFPDKKLPIYSSLGVKQILDYLEGKIDNDTLIENWTGSELDYARRQMVWFKKQLGIIWYDMNTDRNKLALELSSIFN